MECCGTTYSREYKGESANFWPHLQTAGLREPNANFIPDNTVGVVPRSIQPNPTLPAAVIAKNTGVYPFTLKNTTNAGTWGLGNWTVYFTNTTPPANYYFIADFTNANSYGISSGTNTTLAWKESILVADAKAIDSKMDDGDARSGQILNASYMEGSNYNTGCAANGNSNYSVSGTGLCALIIQMPKF